MPGSIFLAKPFLHAAIVGGLLGSVVLLASTTRAQCVDEALREQLVGKRAHRGVVPRLFRKALRHEIAALGGWYAADLSDGEPVYGGAYTFHASEDLGLEISYLRTRKSYGFLQAINDRQQGLIDIVESEAVPIQLFMGHLVWSLAYGKVRWFGGPIGRFDFHLAVGGGATDEDGSTSLTGSGGFGMKLHFTQWLVFRLDVRDQIRSLRAPLGVEKVVNDISVLGGLGLFVPFTP